MTNVPELHKLFNRISRERRHAVGCYVLAEDCALQARRHPGDPLWVCLELMWSIHAEEHHRRAKALAKQVPLVA